MLRYRTWYLGDDREKYSLVDGHRQGPGIVVRLEGIEDRDAAANRIGRKIYIPASELPPLENGEYFWADLAGLEVVNLNGDPLGVVDHLFETGANDVMVIAGSAGEVLAPFVPDVVREVDLERGFIRLDWEIDG